MKPLTYHPCAYRPLPPRALGGETANLLFEPRFAVVPPTPVGGNRSLELVMCRLPVPLPTSVGSN